MPVVSPRHDPCTLPVPRSKDTAWAPGGSYADRKAVGLQTSSHQDRRLYFRYPSYKSQADIQGTQKTKNKKKKKKKKKEKKKKKRLRG